VCIQGKARRQLENLCRYAGRPAEATERLSKVSDGQVLYRLRHHRRDGTAYVIFGSMDLIGKLAALVPPPRFNLVRCHGVLAQLSQLGSKTAKFELTANANSMPSTKAF
jgi:hypothetical protein